MPDEAPARQHAAEQAPSWALLALEGRAIAELQLFLWVWPLLRRAPRGDGHTVLVLPGFTAGDASTFALRAFLDRQGYQARRWGLGRNLGLSNTLEVRMIRRLQMLYDRSGAKVSLVGWSLGGIYARELAREHPEMVRQVITLGSPFAQSPRATNVWRLYEAVSGDSIEELEGEMLERIREPVEVPTTAVYSRSDGVASWRACMEAEGAWRENVEIPGSHCGFGHNPFAIWVIADRLAQAEGAWRPFEAPRWLAALQRDGGSGARSF